jgi:hypothetical protein
MADKTSSPQGGNRACLCKDGKTYSKDCCKGELINQGVGSLVQQGTSVIINTNTVRQIN